MTEENKEVENVFSRALKAIEAQQAEVEAKKNFVPYSYEEYEPCALESNKEKVVRPVGDPFDPQTLKSAKPTDVKIFLHSKVFKDDKSGYVNLNWPATVKTTKSGVKIVPDSEWIFSKLFNKVYEKEWISYPEGQVQIRNGRKCTGEWKFLHKDTDIYKRLELNGDGIKYDGQMNKLSPSAMVYMNVIDRTDNWCETNKHTKVLLNKLGIGKSYKNDAGIEITPKYPSKGISHSLYEKIFDTLVKASGGWNRDCVIKKTGEGLDTKYLVFDASDLRVQTKDISEESFKLSKESGMPSDWGMYDLSVKTNPTSATKLNNTIKGIFKLFDATFPEFNLTEELESLAKKEAEDRNASSKTEAENSLEAEKRKQAEELKQESKSEVKEEPKLEAPKERARVQTGSASQTIEDLCKVNFVKFDSLPEDEKKILIASIEKFDGTVPVWKTGTDLGPCNEDGCTFKGTTITVTFPFDMKHCPCCGCNYDN